MSDRPSSGTPPRSQFDPQRIGSYFREQWPCLLLISVTGIVYNVGLGSAVPYWEGQMAGALTKIFQKSEPLSFLIQAAVTYALVVLIVQFARFIKRLYVRRFANRMSRHMKKILYASIVRIPAGQSQSAGSAMTKALSDAEDFVEGCRKVTTEIFDTGVVMVTYLVMLFSYDWRLSLLCLLFPPLAYLLAEKLKKPVTESSALAKESQGHMSDATLDRARGALTYRVYGQETNQNALYEETLLDYEKKATRANLLQAVPQSVYQILAMIGAIFILYFGARNVMGSGWKAWDIAAFTTYLSCFSKLAVKSSHAAKLITAVQKAEVSWQRIRPLLQERTPQENAANLAPGTLSVQDVSLSFEEGAPLFAKVSLEARPGQIVGITGPIASGKSALGKLFLDEFPYTGTITWNGQDLKALAEKGLSPVGYSGHDPELFSDSIENNITLGQDPHGHTLGQVLQDVRLDVDLTTFPEKEKTLVGEGGERLSGGQKARLALARALYSGLPLLVLDDPFAALDDTTEKEILEALRGHYQDRTILLISHRLKIFPSLDGILFLKKDTPLFGTHETLLREDEAYRRLYTLQKGGEDHA